MSEPISTSASANPPTGTGVTGAESVAPPPGVQVGEGAQAPPQPVQGDPAQVPFKEQVKGHAKTIAGKVFRNEDEVKLGQAKLNGEI